MAPSARDERSRLLDEEQSSMLSDATIAPAKVTPLPWRPFFILVLLVTAQPVAFEVIFPFVNQMILEIGVVSDPEQVGFYSGFIESIFSFMSFIAVLPISRMSDYYGRKPIVLLSVLTIAISVVAFSFSKSFLAMVLTRCIGGAAGGSEGAMRIMAGEMTDRSNQGVAFSAITISYRAGQVIGLPLGGLLAHPERNFSLFQGRFWYAYPYALPCLVAATFAVLGVLVGYFLLEETLPSKRKVSFTPDSAVEDGAATTVPIGMAGETLPPQTTVPDDFKPAPLLSILTPSIISLLVSNMAMCFICEVIFAVYPLFSFTPIHLGGLGMSEAAIGSYLAVRAAIAFGVMFGFVPLERLLGSLRIYQLAFFSLCVSILFYPLLHAVAAQNYESSWPLNVSLFFFFLVWSFGGMAWTAISVLINDASPSASALAALNGISQMAIILPQAIGPAFVTSLFATSISTGIAGGNLIWIVLFVLTSVATVHSLFLREATHDWRKDAAGIQQ